MKTNNYMKTLALTLGLLVASACTIEDQLINPNTPTPEAADNEFLFNGISLSFAGFFLNTTGFGMDQTRMLAMFGSTYENAYSANSFNGVWTSAYSDVMINADLLLSKTTDDPATTVSEYNPFYQGATKTMKAYVMMTLVDFFGDVPYSEAVQGLNNFNPVADPGSAVYADVMDLLNEAVTDFNNGGAGPGGDVFYAGDSDKWRKFAKTLKMKAFLQTRLVQPTVSRDSIAALIADGDLISAPDEEFVFRTWGNSISNPNTYHPWFFGNYAVSAGQYMSNSYMYELYDAKNQLNGVTLTPTVRDPRIRFYFYRQTTTPTTDVNNLTCAGGSPPAHYPVGTPYCQLPAGYWGRDHLNDEGIPPDGLLRTTYGLYPAGGVFDASQSAGVDVLDNLEAGAKGKGILPIMMASYVGFMEAEYQLMLENDPAAARTALISAMNTSINRVIAFDPSQTPTSGAVVNTFNATAIANYVNRVLSFYDSGVPIAPNTTLLETQLDVIVKEYWVASWGNGIESYNTTRRTGKPANLQPGLELAPGAFYRTFTYPAVYVIRNNNAEQKVDNKVQVFWDTNPANFIK